MPGYMFKSIQAEKGRQVRRLARRFPLFSSWFVLSFLLPQNLSGYAILAGVSGALERVSKQL